MAKPFRDGHTTELSYYQPEDFEKLAEWFYNVDYRFFFRYDHDLLEDEDFKNYGKTLAKSGVHLLSIRDKSSQEIIGLMTFMVYKPAAKTYKFGIMLDQKHQGKTWAIDAIIVLFDYIFRVCNGHKLVVEFCDEDEQIHRITKKGGFTFEGILKDEIFIDGEFKNEARYCIFAEDHKRLYGDYLD